MTVRVSVPGREARVIACLQMTWLRDERGDVVAACCGRRDGHPGPHVDNRLDYQWTTSRSPEQVP